MKKLLLVLAVFGVSSAHATDGVVTLVTCTALCVSESYTSDNHIVSQIRPVIGMSNTQKEAVKKMQDKCSNSGEMLKRFTINTTIDGKASTATSGSRREFDCDQI